jgi:hypothetical protein
MSDLPQELLALEERIGYVSTGLPDDRISKCLKETTYYTSNKSQSDSCVICMVFFYTFGKERTLFLDLSAVGKTFKPVTSQLDFI